MSSDFVREGKAQSFSGELHKELSISSGALESTCQPPLPSAHACCAKPDWQDASHVCMADAVFQHRYFSIFHVPALLRAEALLQGRGRPGGQLLGSALGEAAKNPPAKPGQRRLLPKE